MTPKEILLNILSKKEAPRCGVANPVSSTTIEQMKMMNSFFPEAHYNSKKIQELSDRIHKAGFKSFLEVVEYD
ncbi:hypothetical protein LLG07_04395 [bacterium]|nr:hypothetical protein [bacterium]